MEQQQLTHSMSILDKKSCPTALACSSSGNLCFVAFTDDSLRVIDMRTQDGELLFKNGHDGMIKSIWVSPDESLLYTGGSDGTVRIWDIGQRSVVQTYGQSKHLGRQADGIIEVPYHTDSVTTLIPNCSQSTSSQIGYQMFSASRDGSICELDILSKEHVPLFAQRDPITCLAEDSQNGYMWFGAAHSEFGCFHLQDQEKRQEWKVQESFSPEPAEREVRPSMTRDESVFKKTGKRGGPSQHIMTLTQIFARRRPQTHRVPHV